MHVYKPQWHIFLDFSKSEPKSVAWFIFHSKPYLSNYIGMVCMDFSKSKPNSLMAQCVNKSRYLEFCENQKRTVLQIHAILSQARRPGWCQQWHNWPTATLYMVLQKCLQCILFSAFSCPSYLKSQRIGTRCYYMMHAWRELCQGKLVLELKSDECKVRAN